MRPLVLITNDDGYDSVFLQILADALATRYRIAVAAPLHEQSWIGRAVSRRKDVRVQPVANQSQHPTWAIDGTPSDCVNIALHHLLKETPVAVVSGINIGYNTATNLIYSSGTIAGALEGAFAGLTAFAISQQVPDSLFEQVTLSKGQLPEAEHQVVCANAQHAVDLIADVLSKSSATCAPDAIVHNLNYPIQPIQPYRLTRTVPVPLAGLSLWQQEQDNVFRFRFQNGKALATEQPSDRDAILAGEVSHGILNFSAIGRDLTATA